MSEMRDNDIVRLTYIAIAAWLVVIVLSVVP